MSYSSFFSQMLKIPLIEFGIVIMKPSLLVIYFIAFLLLVLTTGTAGAMDCPVTVAIMSLTLALPYKP